ncbi:MAG: GspH/FimT family pseudopilin [Phycisphaeraceae bacterium]
MKSEIRNPKSEIRRRGFTLVEVLIVVTIIGIAGAVIVPHMLTTGSLGIQAAGRMVIADLLYAQNEAIAQQSPCRVVFDPPNNRYYLTDGAGNVMSTSWKGDGLGNYVVNFNEDSRFAGVTISAAEFDDTLIVEFDALGAPTNGGTIDLTADGFHYRVSVADITGRVTIAAVTAGP